MMQDNPPTYFEVIDPVRHTRNQWIVEPNQYGEWGVRFGSESIRGHWTHFPSVPFDCHADAVAYVQRMVARFKNVTA